MPLVSTNIQGLSLSDELLRHLRAEMCGVYEMAMGVSSEDGSAPAAPIHTDILLTLMVDLLPYENSDKSEFSEERFHGFEAAALPCPPPSPLRWLRHPSAVRRPSFWHL